MTDKTGIHVLLFLHFSSVQKSLKEKCLGSGVYPDEQYLECIQSLDAVLNRIMLKIVRDLCPKIELPPEEPSLVDLDDPVVVENLDKLTKQVMSSPYFGGVP